MVAKRKKSRRGHTVGMFKGHKLSGKSIMAKDADEPTGSKEQICQELENIYDGNVDAAVEAASTAKWKLYEQYSRDASRALDEAKKMGCEWSRGPFGLWRAVNELHTRFLSAALATKVRRVKEMAAEGDRPAVGQTSARDTDFAVFFAVLLRHLACISLEATIENATQYLRDHWATLTPEERDELKNAILKAVEEYQNSCG